VKIKTENLVEDEAIDTVFTKSFAATIPLELQGGEINQSMDWYYGPSDFKVLDAYNRNLDELVPFGWGLFGWINRYIFMPLFGFLGSYMSYGIAIVVMTVLVKFLLSFVQYKQFLSQAKMKILKPELDAIREKHKDNKMKAQQETMALQTKAGASPMAGCLPALIQLPVFYALFQFFPSAFDLRQKSFLWVKDLSSYVGIILVIKNFILDEDKIHAQIQEKKKQPKKQNRFQKKMAEMMEQAEKQKQAQQKKK